MSMHIRLAIFAFGVAFSTGLSAAADSDAACRTALVVNSRRLVPIPWDKVKPTGPDAAFGASASSLRVKVYETLTQDASWRFHNNVLPQLIKTYGEVAAFEIYLHPSADFRNVLASQMVSCAPLAKRLEVMNALFKATADGTLLHDDANTTQACGAYYAKLYALAQNVMPLTSAKFAQCMESYDGLVHQDAIDKMSYQDGVRRNPAIFVNGNVAYDYELGAVTRRLDAAR